MLLSAGLAFLVFFVFYRAAVRRVLLDRVRFKLFALRDELRDLAVDEKVSPTCFPYDHLERSLCELIKVAPFLNIYRFGQFVIWRRHISVPARDVRFKQVAPDELKDIEERSIDALFWVLMINSPLGAMLMAFVVGAAYGAARVNSKLQSELTRICRFLWRQGRAFIEQELDNHSFA